ncbi:succinate dehydrogenase assembly factor 2 [Thiomicrorhabdus sp. 6S2-11]|uniref:FAD assembly factor SdhE n=1 Tax=Thiomicrorhabdus marina TaxID=2818442 RepID=A0ABS3Q3J9_9GAMM|nr:succinate dehydrogenase assembly factor 2 [Thiomicrorhabdus marina]MBO1926872.1 succinate dehydrogenase assembly factor 2 [Thiomicrorhabdus marina]
MTKNLESNSVESFQIWQKRMLFACKRGNIETELLLNRYISKLEKASPKLRIHIETFLSENEQDLFHWLIKPSSIPYQAHHSTTPTHYLTLISDIQKVYLKK